MAIMAEHASMFDFGVPNIVGEERSCIRKAEACDPNMRKQSGISTVCALLLLLHRVRLQFSALRQGTW